MAIHAGDSHATDSHATDYEERKAAWHPRPLSLVLIGLADFSAAVGLGSLLLGQAAAAWFVGGAVLLLVGIAASD